VVKFNVVGSVQAHNIATTLHGVVLLVIRGKSIANGRSIHSTAVRYHVDSAFYPP